MKIYLCKGLLITFILASFGRIGVAQKNQVDSSLLKISLQKKQTFSFANSGVFFKNDFSSARLNDVKQLNDSTYTLSITAENRPINSSPWYAFKIVGIKPQRVYLTLSYPNDKHRYNPKVSKDGLIWASLERPLINEDHTEATFKVNINKDTLTVAAQQIISSSDNQNWMDELSERSILNKQIIGYSINQKPITALNTVGASGNKMIVVISRQHPPEVTGYMAMQKFVAMLLAETERAKKFREEFELVIIPMVNPDGVDEGNWRHNFGGVDLNRDWIDFKQPETKAVRDYLIEKVKKQNAKVYFAIDFHSTHDDVLYTNENRNDTNMPGLVTKWIAGLHQLEGKKQTPVRASGNGGNVSKAWFGKVLNAEALTYEVGDNTPIHYIYDKVTKVAEVLMENLANK